MSGEKPGANLCVEYVNKGKDYWFSPRNESKAKEICNKCTSLQKCFDRSIFNQSVNPDGIWGGKNKEERAAERQRIGIPEGIEDDWLGLGLLDVDDDWLDDSVASED